MEKITFKKAAFKVLPYLILIIAAFLSCYLYFLPGLAPGDDVDFHVSMVVDLLYGFEHGYFFYSTNHLYVGGFSLFNFAFYGPVTHYGAAIFTFLFRWAGATPITGLKFMVFASSILGEIFMYFLALKISKNNVLIALISTVMFVFMPYRIFCLICRCAFAEGVAMALIPMVFYGAYSFVHDEKYHVMPYVSLSCGAALIILTHPYTGLITAVFAAFYVLFNVKPIIMRRRNLPANISFVSSMLIITMLVLFFVLTSSYYKSLGIYNLSDAKRQWTNYDHISDSTKDSFSYSGFLKFDIIKEWTGASWWNDETVPSTIFSIVLYFVSMTFAIVSDYLIKPLKYSKYYRPFVFITLAFIFPIIFNTRIEIFLAIAISAALYFTIKLFNQVLPTTNSCEVKIYKRIDFYYLLVALFICAIFIFVPVSWKIVPKIFYNGQFAWRLWSVVSFLVAMLVAFLLSNLKIKKESLIIVSVLAASLMTLAMGTLEKRVYYEKQSNRIMNNVDYAYVKKQNYSGKQNEMVPMIYYDNSYVPQYENSLYRDIKTIISEKSNLIYDVDTYIKPVFLTGSGDVLIYEYNTPNNIFHINIESDSALVQFPQFYYANYTAYSNGKKVATAINVDGLITFELSKGTYDLALKFRPYIGYTVTVPFFYIGVFLLFGGGVAGYIYRKKYAKEETSD